MSMVGRTKAKERKKGLLEQLEDVRKDIARLASALNAQARFLLDQIRTLHGNITSVSDGVVIVDCSTFALTRLLVEKGIITVGEASHAQMEALAHKSLAAFFGGVGDLLRKQSGHPDGEIKMTGSLVTEVAAGPMELEQLRREEIKAKAAELAKEQEEKKELAAVARGEDSPTPEGQAALTHPEHAAIFGGSSQ